MGASVLALCQAAALTHLPFNPPTQASIAAEAGVGEQQAALGWSPQQASIADAVHDVLSALVLIQGFGMQQQAQGLSALIEDEDCWCDTHAVRKRLLDNYIDAAVQGPAMLSFVHL